MYELMQNWSKECDLNVSALFSCWQLLEIVAACGSYWMTCACIKSHCHFCLTSST